MAELLMGERQSCEDEGDQMDVFVLMGERQSCDGRMGERSRAVKRMAELRMTRWMCLC